MGVSKTSPHYILGVQPGAHDAAAALLRDGELVAMIEQERLSRNRHAVGESPSEAIKACLAEEGVDLTSVAEIAIGWDMPGVVEILRAGPFEERDFAEWLVGDCAVPGSPLPPLHYVEHHIAHAASAFYTSGMDEAAILVLDGKGERVATTIATGGPAGIEVVRSWGINESLGGLYAAAADWVGFTTWGTGKLMGLASYGAPSQPTPLSTTESGFAIEDAPPADSPLAAQLARLRDRMHDRFAITNFPYCQATPGDTMAYAGFAASIQGALEETILTLATIARRETGHTDLAVAGGVALNCTANGRLIRSGIFDRVWVPPFPYDAGVSLGAALVADRRTGKPAARPPRLAHAFWAPETGGPDADTLAQLSDCELHYAGDDLTETVAGHLAAGKLVAWWQGRAEIGQRALGARSILCDPRRRQALTHTNAVKGREPWRPLAPVVRSGHVEEIFDDPLPPAADFMLAAYAVREQARARIPAAVHVDGSARPQVARPEHGRYHALLGAFHERTGVPALINTSFNLAGEPIVHGPRDAVSAFLRSDLDVLVLDDLVAVKPSSGEDDRRAPTRPRAVDQTGPAFPLPWTRARSRR